jgi:hypothetical protein
MVNPNIIFFKGEILNTRIYDKKKLLSLPLILVIFVCVVGT